MLLNEGMFVQVCPGLGSGFNTHLSLSHAKWMDRFLCRVAMDTELTTTHSDPPRYVILTR